MKAVKKAAKKNLKRKRRKRKNRKRKRKNQNSMRRATKSKRSNMWHLGKKITPGEHHNRNTRSIKVSRLWFSVLVIQGQNSNHMFFAQESNTEMVKMFSSSTSSRPGCRTPTT